MSPWFPHHQPSSSSSVSVLKTLIWSPSLQCGIATNFGGTSGISHMFLWFFFVFVFGCTDVNCLLGDGFFLGGMYWCWLFPVWGLWFYYFYLLYYLFFCRRMFGVILLWDMHEFSKKFCFTFFLTINIEVWLKAWVGERCEKRVFWSLW